MTDDKKIDFRAILRDCFLSGHNVRIKKDGYLDKIFHGISDILQSVYGDSKLVGKVTDPYVTDMLDDLERDYGLINDDSIDDSMRRDILNAFMFRRNSNGDDIDFLQTRLRSISESGNIPSLTVHKYDGTVNPYTVSKSGGGEYLMYLGDGNAYLGSGTAYLSKLIGELLVDGVNDDSYDVPISSRHNYIFIVGGSSTGWVYIYDGDMELKGLTYWTEGIGTLLYKDTEIKNKGNRSIAVVNNGNIEEQETFPLVDDPTLVSSYRMFDLDGALNRPSENTDFGVLSNDYDMEQADVSAWSISGGCLAEKSTYICLSGSQSLHLTIVTAITDYCYQDILTIGNTYVIDVAVTVQNAEYEDVVIINNGEEIYRVEIFGGTSFKPIRFEFVAAGTDIGISAGGGCDVYIDNFICYEVTNNLVSNGSFDDNIDSWAEYNSPTYEIDDTLTSNGGYSIGSLKLNGESVYNIGLYQDCLEVGKRYSLNCFIKGDNTLGGSNTCVPFIKCGLTDIIYIASDDTDFVDGEINEVSFDFVATDTFIFLGSIYTAPY